MKNFIRIVTTIILVLVVDLTTKHFLFDVQYFNLIPNIISVATNGGNDGAAWGIFSGKVWQLVLISIIMIIGLLIFNHFVKNKNKFYCISFGLVIGGALGNMYDRITLGYVRDFIFLDFMPNFPVFNIADSCLCVGVVMLALFIIFKTDAKNDKTETKSEK